LEPVTIGEHVRKRRIDLGMAQADVAGQIGVTESTVWNWEHGVEPELRHIPSIVTFLGYVPFDMPENPIEKLRYLKRLRGLSYERLGKLIKKSPEQLTDWLSGRVSPCKRNVQRIETFLSRTLKPLP